MEYYQKLENNPKNDHYKIKIDDTTHFVTLIYKYYLYGGYKKFILTAISNILISLFLCVLFSIIVNCINYNLLLSKTENDYFYFSDILEFKNLYKFSYFNCFLYTIYLSIFLWKCNKFIYELPNIKKIDFFYRTFLEIKDESIISNIQWSYVTKKLLEYHISAKEFKIHNVFDNSVELMTSHNISNRIMRKENYILSLFKNKVINIPYKHYVLNNIFEQSFWFILDIHPNRNIVRYLKERTIIIILFFIIFMPFISIYTIFYTIIEHSDIFYKKNMSNITDYSWTTYAKYKLRKYNELPHIFKKRTQTAKRYLIKYLLYWSNSYSNAIFETFFILIGSIILFFVFLSILNDNTFTLMIIFKDRTTLWVIGMLTPLLGICHSQINNKTVKNLEKKLNKVNILLGNEISRNDIKNCYTSKIKNKISRNLEYRFVSILKNIIGICITPYILYKYILFNSSKIEEFIKENSNCIENTTFHVCSYANFEKNKQNKSYTDYEYINESENFNRVYDNNDLMDSEMLNKINI